MSFNYSLIRTYTDTYYLIINLMVLAFLQQQQQKSHSDSLVYLNTENIL